MTTIGIRLEDKSPWERRTPLIPEDVAELVRDHGVRCLVEPSPRRIYGDDEYERAGAVLAPDLSPAGVVFGVKEIPLAKLQAGKAYVFFAHVIKGQKHNRPLLRRLLELGCTLIDYELITGEDRKRLVLFGREAGQAGMIDALHFLGRRLAAEGDVTPLADVRPAHRYRDLADAEAELAEVGARLRAGFPLADPPLVAGFTGAGNVSRGAQDVFDVLPHEEVAPEALADLRRTAGEVRDRLFKVRFAKRHLAAPLAPGKTFDEAEFRDYPERFRGRLAEYLPHVTALVHGIFWTDDYPRYLSRAEAQAMWRAGERKLRLVADVSCDVDGAIELTYKATQPDRPTYVYDPAADDWRDGDDGPGIVVLAVDNLPCELPRDASDRFSRALRPFVPAIAAADYAVPYAELALPPEIHRAVICHRGELTPQHRRLQKYLE